MGAEWVFEEMSTMKLADERLTKRAKQMIASLSEQPAKSIPEASENWAATKGAYRFLENERVEESQIRAAHYQATQARASGQRRILAIQDTTDLDYTGKQVAEQLGPLSNQYTRGLAPAFGPGGQRGGRPAGVGRSIHLEPRSRYAGQGQRPAQERHGQDKESQRWLDALQAAETAPAAGRRDWCISPTGKAISTICWRSNARRAANC